MAEAARAGWEAAVEPAGAAGTEASAASVAPVEAAVGLCKAVVENTSLTARTTRVAGWAAAPALAEKEAPAAAETAAVVAKVPP